MMVKFERLMGVNIFKQIHVINIYINTSALAPELVLEMFEWLCFFVMLKDSKKNDVFY